jgi:hypothetical protein
VLRKARCVDVHVPVLVVVKAVDVIGVGRHDLVQRLIQRLGRTGRGHLHRPRTQKSQRIYKGLYNV